MPFFPRFLTVWFFFLLCTFLYHSLVPLESFKERYTDSTCLMLLYLLLSKNSQNGNKYHVLAN